jgi:glycosyltransferase involved in cell wall biosynthesis
MAIATLHVDIEGGWGGSSVSLFELIKRLDRTRITPVVAHRQDGPIAARYAEIGVPTYHVREITSFVPRAEKALKNFVASWPSLLQLDRAAARLAEIAARHGSAVVHLNYEGLFLLAQRLRRRLNLPMVAHSRALLPANRWGRWVVRQLARNVEHVFFISPQEEARWRELAPPDGPSGEVMWNIAREPLPRRPFGEPPEIVYLGNIAWTKGADRLLDIAAELRRRGEAPLRFAVYGRARTEPDYERAIRARIDKDSLGDWVELRGHIADPSPVLARAFALVRPSREDDPWGRDVIEACAAGVPVLATGRFDGVVRPGINGELVSPYDAARCADVLAQWRADPGRWRRLSEEGMQIGGERFGGAAQAEQFARAIERVVDGAARRAA